jgi:uncharacterized protein YndB with AHSA1/START domain
MTVTSVETDVETLSLTLIADFAAPVEEVWKLWADPRLLERWWGPPTYPATFEAHDLAPGGEVTYFMTSPEGEKYRGWWQITAVDPPKSLEFVDGFADADGNKATDMPLTTTQMQLADHDGGTRMEVHSTFDSAEQMDQLVTMGMVEGLTAAMGQMDALLPA